MPFKCSIELVYRHKHLNRCLVTNNIFLNQNIWYYLSSSSYFPIGFGIMISGDINFMRNKPNGLYESSKSCFTKTVYHHKYVYVLSFYFLYSAFDSCVFVTFFLIQPILAILREPFFCGYYLWTWSSPHLANSMKLWWQKVYQVLGF